jgi:hypothetical protein
VKTDARSVWVRLASLECVVALVMLTILPAAVSAGARLVVSWKNPAYTGAKPTHVLVIGMSKDPAIRLDFEDDLASAIVKDGVKVTPGNHILLRPTGPDMDETYLKGQIRDFKIDGVIVSRLVSVDKKTTYTPGSSYVVPYGYYNNFYGYYGTVYRQVYTPGYLQKDTTVRIETNLYSAGADTSSGELIWTATSDSFNPSSATKVIDEVVKVVAKELKKKNLL